MQVVFGAFAVYVTGEFVLASVLNHMKFQTTYLNGQIANADLKHNRWVLENTNACPEARLCEEDCYAATRYQYSCRDFTRKQADELVAHNKNLFSKVDRFSPIRRFFGIAKLSE